MSRPDLSFLLNGAGDDGTPAPSTPQAESSAGDHAQPERRGPGRARGEIAALIEVLRASKAELEAQNRMLRYSQAVAESASERFEALFANVPLALMVLDEHDVVVQANSMAHRSFQPSERDRPLTALMPFVQAAHAERVRAAFEQARASGAAEALEVVLCIDEQRRISGDLHIARIDMHGQEGEAPQTQFLCAVIDQGPLLAERQALQRSAAELQERNAQLHASERRLEAVINSALDAIICVDQHQRITVFNPTAAMLFQCAASDALGSPITRFIPKAEQMLAFAQLTTQAVLGEMTALAASGRELAVEVSVSFERHAEGETTTVFARDLTARKREEARRSELESQLRESHKMQAMGTMAGGIAHDFNNILHAILGNVELAREGTQAGTPAHESLLEIDKAGRRARDLVRQILTFSRNEPPRRTRVALAEVARDTQRLLRVTQPPHIALSVHEEGGVPPVLADPTQVEQALLNLCTNAVHAIGAHRGAIHMDIATAQPAQRLREKLGLGAEHYVSVTVRDDGPGIDAATLSRIFEPFFTTKAVGQGTGLGLAVVHGVMRTHGGAVDVHSAPGQGSRFTLYFPAALEGDVPAAPAPAAPAPTAAEPARVPAPGGTRHVMYVDDDEALVSLVQRLLRRRGYKVSGFTDPRQATQALRAAPGRYDLLVTDYNMPGFSGLDMLRAARAIRADLPIALASGYVTADIEQQALAEGARALIHKPNDVQELCATVDRLVHGQ
ncbi:hybrid sensor histidine kinase/response regulator [Melaminivora suipulveris]|uniref:histidine kinase n=1 Tax=Melaminivora suipulveris TaxID=2109913 RepID=A0A2R3QFQ6_9BURK|nr:ATP-binding protein [Melaminivora suipulveris]AVO50608.1 hybrid sensor histidine kinase/response regulator [Melaminivora suipulveris]